MVDGRARRGRVVRFGHPGFTLIELMVVVAIIGILSSMAITTYLALIAGAKKVEAKTNLSSIVNDEIAYFSEQNQFAADFAALGWTPEGRNIYEYRLGTAGTSCAAMALTTGCDDIRAQTSPPVATCLFTRPTGPQTPSEAATGFTATAEGNIDPGDPTDAWSISDAKDLRNDCDEVL